MNKIESSREIQEKDRFNSLKNQFFNFIEKNKEIQDYVYLNEDLLNIVVGSYFDDIYRFKEYSNSNFADNHKQAAYTIKWISKIKPIQINKNAPPEKKILVVNSFFALFAGFSFLNENVTNTISTSYLIHLAYSTLYRNISGRQLASTLYALECCALNKKP